MTDVLRCVSPVDGRVYAEREVASEAAIAAALRAARERPRAPILCLTPLTETARRLSIAWGINAVVSPDAINFADMIAKATSFARSSDMAQPGDNLVVTAGVPFGSPGNTNVLRIARVEAAS